MTIFPTAWSTPGERIILSFTDTEALDSSALPGSPFTELARDPARDRGRANLESLLKFGILELGHIIQLLTARQLGRAGWWVGDLFNSWLVLLLGPNPLVDGKPEKKHLMSLFGWQPVVTNVLS